MLILLFFEDFWDSSPQSLRMAKHIILRLKTSALTTFFKILRALPSEGREKRKAGLPRNIVVFHFARNDRA